MTRAPDQRPDQRPAQRPDQHPAQRLVAAARGWIGTPYLHQASVRGAGCDCLGLIRGIWREVHGEEPLPIPPYTADWSEPQGDERLWRAAKGLLRAGTGHPGDLLLFRMREGSVAKHLGLLSQGGREPAFIHSMSGHGVVESPLSAPWAARIVARFDLAHGPRRNPNPTEPR